MAKKKLSRFESSQVISMFPTLVWKTQFKTKFYETINKSIVNKLNEMTKSIPELIPDESCQSEQTKTCLEKVEALLNEAGSDKTLILQTTIGLDYMTDFPKMNEVWGGWITPGTSSARACGEAKLASPEYKVEVIVVAARK